MIVGLIALILVVLACLLSSSKIGSNWRDDTRGLTIVFLVVGAMWAIVYGAMFEGRAEYSTPKAVSVMKSKSQVIVDADGVIGTWSDAETYNSVGDNTKFVIRKSFDHFGFSKDTEVRIAK